MEWFTIEMEYAIGISSCIIIDYEDDLSHDLIIHKPYISQVLCVVRTANLASWNGHW